MIHSFMTIVLIILIVKKVFSIFVIAAGKTELLQINLSFNHVVIFYFLIYVNFLQLNLFGVAQCLLFEVVRYNYMLVNRKIV